MAQLSLPGCGSQAAPPPRVILITCDTLRADRLGCYGYARDVSPQLDQLARESTRFTAAYSCAPMTLPAVSSMMTGRLPEEIGVTPGNFLLLPESVTTLAESLQVDGVATAAVVSNWLLRRSEQHPGVGVAQGFDVYDDTMESRERNRPMFERPAAATTDAALAVLDRFPTGPLFLWVHYQDPHGPYTPPADLLEKFAHPPGGAALLRLGATQEGRGQLPQYQDLDGERHPDVYRQRYDAEIAYFDQQLGRLLAGLKQRDWYDAATLVMTADHGESLGEHDYWFCHGENVHRETVRVPLLVRRPGGAGGAVEDGLVGHLDVFPTIRAAFGLPSLAGRGVSLLTDRPPAGRVLPQALFPDTGGLAWWAATDGRYRVVWSREDPRYRLYDLQTDPGEQQDLSAQHPEIVAALREANREFLAEGTVVTVPGAALDTSGADREALQALGYLEDDSGEQ